MRLIIGGAYQGKRDYAMHTYKIAADKIIDGAILNEDKIYGFECINNFHLLIKNLLEKGGNPIEFTENLLLENPDITIIMNEIGNGIIPLNKSERVWREEVGKVGRLLAKQAKSVERIVCGIVVNLKS